MKLHKNITLLSLHNFFTDFILFAPVAILYFERVTGSYALGMSIFSVAYASSALLEIPTGVISDYIGRKKTLILGSVCSVLCIILYAIGQSYWILFIGALLQGASRAFYSGNNDALLHDTLKTTNQTHLYDEFLGKISSLFQVGLAAAALLGGFLAHSSFSLVMWLSVLPQIGAFFVSLFIIEPKRTETAASNIYQHLGTSLKAFIHQKNLRSLSLASIIRFSFGESGYFFRSAFVAALWPLWAIGISNMLSNIGGAFSFFFSGKILKKFPPEKVLVAEIIVNRCINTIALLFPTVYSPFLMTTTSLSFGVSSVATNTLMQKQFSDAQRATMSSINSFGGSISFAIVSVAIGAFADRFGPVAALLIIQLFLLLPLFFYRTAFKK